MKRPATAAGQDELPFHSIQPEVMFEGRHTLYVHEVARALRCDARHVIALIEEWRDTGGVSGLEGFSIASGLQSAGVTNGNKTPRGCWRVASTALKKFLLSRAPTA